MATLDQGKKLKNVQLAAASSGLHKLSAFVSSIVWTEQVVSICQQHRLNCTSCQRLSTTSSGLHKLSAFGFIVNSKIKKKNTADPCLETSDDTGHTASTSDDTGHRASISNSNTSQQVNPPLSDSSDVGVVTNSRNEQNKQAQSLHKSFQRIFPKEN